MKTFSALENVFYRSWRASQHTKYEKWQLVKCQSGADYYGSASADGKSMGLAIFPASWES